MFALVRNASLQEWVYVFDKAVRLRVARGNDCLLTDSHMFNNAYNFYVMPAIAGSASPFKTANRGNNTLSDKGNKKAKRKKDDTCNNFNLGKCPHNASSCKYVHRCIKCAGAGHRMGDPKCPQRDA